MKDKLIKDVEGLIKESDIGKWHITEFAEDAKEYSAIDRHELAKALVESLCVDEEKIIEILEGKKFVKKLLEISLSEHYAKKFASAISEASVIRIKKGG